MNALQIADAETMRIALQQEISRSDESRYDHRLHGVLLVGQGHSCYEVFQAPTRKSVALFGAVNLLGGQMMAHFNRVFEAESFLAFLKGLRRRRARGKKMVLITDHAAYPHAAGLKGWLHENRNELELLFLPPCSPELNPIERVWKLLRKLCTHNEYFPELELLENALTRQLNQWWKPNAVLRRLCCIT